MKRIILLVGVLSLLLLSACAVRPGREDIKSQYCLSQGYYDVSSVCDNGKGWCDWQCYGNKKESHTFDDNPVHYIKLGQAICEERYKKDFDSFDGTTLNCKAKPKTERYDGIKIAIH